MNRFLLAIFLMVLVSGSLISIRSAGAEEKSKECFLCKGSGASRCSNAVCREGRVDCPKPCVKASGIWIKQPTPSHSADTLWQKVKFIPRGSGYVSQGHIGEYFTVDASGKVTPHTCETCQGNSSLPCPTCRGQGKLVCAVCTGKKVVPVSWSAFDHPKMKDRPSRFTMKDGRVLIGRKRKVVDSEITLRTESGDIVIDKSQLASEVAQPTER